MLTDLIPFEQLRNTGNGMKRRAIQTVIDFLVRKFGVSIGYDARTIPFGDIKLIEAVRLGELLRSNDIIKSFGQGPVMHDEPRMLVWSAICNVPSEHQVSGASFDSDEKALTAACAEGLERYIWLTQSDYFKNQYYGTEAAVSKRGRCIGTHRWVSFSPEQRSAVPERELKPHAQYLWVHAESLIDGSPVYIPAQIISGKDSVRARNGGTEPVIRYTNTTGLATWPTREGARLSGMLELLERDAYMITWFNQLTLPRIDLSQLAQNDVTLARALQQCRRYRLKIHAVPLLTDAPTHVICVVTEDESGGTPRFTVGLKAHRSLSSAVLKALTEALRARRASRMYTAKGNVWNDTTPVMEIGHRDRLYYWGMHGDSLEFLIKGEVHPPKKNAWDDDTEAEHLARLISWCKTSGLECVSVAVGHSKKNPTPFHIEMVAMPDLQPTYLREYERAFGGERWRTIPEKFGYTSRRAPFDERPHPFS